MYDTPPTGRWQQPIQSTRLEEVDGIYDTPRSVQSQADSETEVTQAFNLKFVFCVA